MKILLTALLIILLVACTSSKHLHSAKANFKIIPDSAETVLKGYINRRVLENEKGMSWFNKNMKYGTPDPTAVTAFKDNKEKFSMLVFGGTWCHDTQNLLPVFYQ